MTDLAGILAAIGTITDQVDRMNDLPSSIEFSDVARLQRMRANLIKLADRQVAQLLINDQMLPLGTKAN